MVHGNIRHKSYLYYLQLAWSRHYGVVFSPDVLWFTVLNELSTHIKDNAKDYATLFTSNTNGKTDICIPTSDAELIDLDVIKMELVKLIPTDVSPFLLKFSTSNEASQMAFNAVFADAMTPFYSYSMYMCGITKVLVLGEIEDWLRIREAIGSLAGILTKINTEYFAKVAHIVDTIIDSYSEPNKEFWKDIFRLDRCGSGGQVEVMALSHKIDQLSSFPNWYCDGTI